MGGGGVHSRLRQPRFLQHQHHGAKGLHRPPDSPSGSEGVRGESEPQLMQEESLLVCYIRGSGPNFATFSNPVY